MKVIPLAKGYVALIDDEDYDLVSKYNWYPGVRPNGMCYVRSHNAPKRTLHKLIMGDPPKGMVIDHRDQNPLNNQKTNLRFVTVSQNGVNIQPHRDKKIKYHVGVYRTDSRYKKPWKVNFRNKTIGYFYEYDDAVTAATKIRLEYLGDI